MQIITSTGFGDSGSSAITDLLSEYDGIMACLWDNQKSNEGDNPSKQLIKLK